MSPIVFPSPKKRTLEDEVRRHRAAMATVTKREKRKLLSGPKKKSKAPRPTAKQRPCRSEDGICGDPCPRVWYARDPYLRDVELRDVWVCYNAYQRGYRRLCRSQGKAYDARHVNGRAEARRRQAVREGRSARPWR